jgi:hypothetical protein
MRSGTTALREVLATNPHIVPMGEVFHSEHLNDENFHHYYKKRIGMNPDLALPSEENRRILFRDFITHLRDSLGLRENDGKVLVVSINYNSLHSLNNYWQNILAEPYLLSFVKTWNFGVIHLIRQNVLCTLLSEMRARASGVWHIKSEGDRAAVTVEINTDTLLCELEERQAEIALVRRWLGGYPYLLELTYEQTFKSGDLINDAVLGQCAAFFGVPCSFAAAVPFRRTSLPSLHQEVSNHEAVARILSASPFARLLDR